MYMHLPPHTNIFIAVFSAVSQHSWSDHLASVSKVVNPISNHPMVILRQRTVPRINPNPGWLRLSGCDRIHVVYIWRFQSAIEFQSVNQTIPSASVPQENVLRHAPCEHCANTARTQREAHANRTRRGKCRESSGWDGVLGRLHKISSENLGTWIYSAVRPTGPQVVIFPVIIRL